MSFEKFTLTRKNTLCYEDVISIYGNGTINIYAGNDLRKKMTDYAVLYFDKEKLRIGIKLVNNSEIDGAIKIYNFDKHPNRYSLFSCFFLKKYNIHGVGIKKRPFKIHSNMITLDLQNEDFD